MYEGLVGWKHSHGGPLEGVRSKEGARERGMHGGLVGEVRVVRRGSPHREPIPRRSPYALPTRNDATACPVNLPPAATASALP